QHPGTDAATGPVKAGAATPDRDKCLLGHVLGRRSVADDPVCQRVNSAAMTVIENLEGLGILGPDQRHQLLIGQPLCLALSNSPRDHRLHSDCPGPLTPVRWTVSRPQYLRLLERWIEGFLPVGHFVSSGCASAFPLVPYALLGRADHLNSRFV